MSPRLQRISSAGSALDADSIARRRMLAVVEPDPCLKLLSIVKIDALQVIARQSEKLIHVIVRRLVDRQPYSRLAPRKRVDNILIQPGSG